MCMRTCCERESREVKQHYLEGISHKEKKENLHFHKAKYILGWTQITPQLLIILRYSYVRYSNYNTPTYLGSTNNGTKPNLEQRVWNSGR
jgi:hypothetical protein